VPRGKPKSSASGTHQACQRSDEMSTPVVLITGALTGIGRAAALTFAKGGGPVVISGRHKDAGQALATELRALGAEVEFVRADVLNVDGGHTAN
jgi:NAD(P)-dependent dehydrogenase (short-subunit alcohol dehydrogenase family)